MSPRDRWLAATGSVVRAALPAAPALVVEIGCGRSGGFVPMLQQQGYAAVGVDPEAPEGPQYRRVRFENYADDAGPVDALVASTSLHHVADPEVVVDQMAMLLRPGGKVVVIEAALEDFDQDTARWCFARLPESDAAPAAGRHHDHSRPNGDPDDEPGSWLEHHRTAWQASGLAWSDYWNRWRAAEGLHPAAAVLAALDRRFERLDLRRGPYVFSDLPGVDAEAEARAIRAGRIAAVGITWIGRSAS